ncbi:MAG: hypothetical protein V7603_3054 [Micromonosporaceae bacterium]
MWDGERRVALGGPQQRAVLALLLIQVNQVVSTERIVEHLWGERAPAAARSLVQGCVAGLRRGLRSGLDDLLVTRAPGYLLRAQPGALDLGRFEDLADTADRLAGTGSRPALEQAAAVLGEALALWRGPAFDGVDLDACRAEAARLAERRLAAIEKRVDIDLRLGSHADLVAELRVLVRDHPLRERLWGQLMLALYRAQRRAEALDVYREVRAVLVGEVGVEPGAALQQIHRTILSGTDEVAPTTARVGTVAARPSGDPPGMGSLPVDIGAFTGRVHEVQQVIRAGQGQVPVIHAIAGMPGVGKTALAVHVAHRLAGRFPDGQLFVDLHGHTAGRSPADPADVLATLLSADGIHPDQLPDGLDARAAAWRQRLAGRRTLVVLDNAASSAQVAPLLPASAECLVLVTSRRFLGDLPAHLVPVSLDVLAPDEAAHMFRRLAPHAGHDEEMVAKLVAKCGFLPLAICLLARLLARHPMWTVGDLLAQTESRLLDVSAEHATVAAAFDLSYRHLPPDRQRLFHTLAVHPGTEIEPYAAAALSGTTVAEAAEHLDALHADNLLTEIGCRRYTMHDLIRSYADALAATCPAERRDGALDRLLGLYQRAAAGANAQLTRVTRPTGSPTTAAAPTTDLPDLADPERALAWLRTERANLLACLAHTADLRRVVSLTAGLTELLRRDGPWTQAISLHAAAAHAAMRLGDRREHANALTDLATVRRLTGDYPGAQDAIRQALARYRDTGDRLGEANALTDLAKTLSRTGNHVDAMHVIAQALDRHRKLGDRLGQAGALVELAVVRGMTADYQGAQRVVHPALRLYRQLGHLPGQAYSLRLVGQLHSRRGRYGEALPALQTALDLYTALGNRSGQALTLTDIGHACSETGHRVKAAQYLRQALAMHRQLAHPMGQAVALEYLGGALRRAGDLPAADQTLHEALTLYRDLGNRSGEATALNEIGALHRLAGRLEAASTCHHDALHLGRLVDSPWDQAHALAGLGRCATLTGQPGNATAHLQRALDIFRHIGAADATEVAAELGDLLGDLR